MGKNNNVKVLERADRLKARLKVGSLTVDAAPLDNQEYWPNKQEAQISQMDRAMRRVSWNLANCQASNITGSPRYVCCLRLRWPWPSVTEIAARVWLDRSRPWVDSQFSTESYATGPPQRLCIHGSATVIRRPTRIRVGSAVVRFVHSRTEWCNCLMPSTVCVSISTPMTARYTSAPWLMRHH